MAKKGEVSHQFPQMYGPRGSSAIGLLSELARFTCPKKQAKASIDIQLTEKKEEENK